MVRGAWCCLGMFALAGCFAPPAELRAPVVEEEHAVGAEDPVMPDQLPNPEPSDDAEFVEDDASDLVDDAESDLDAEESEALRIVVDPQDAAHLAVWTRFGVRRSQDDGRSFASVLEGDGPVWDVVLHAGQIWALRGHRLVGLDKAGDAHGWAMPSEARTDLWPTDDDGEPPAPRLAASARRVALVVPQPEPSRLFAVLSRGVRRGWRTTLPERVMDSSSIGVSTWSVGIDARGRLDVDVGWGQGRECGVAYEGRYRGPVGRDELRLVSEHEDPPFHVRAHDDWVYAACPERMANDRLCAHRPLRANEDIHALRWGEVEPPIEDTYDFVVSGDRTLAQDDRVLAWLVAGRSDQLTADVPMQSRLSAIDARARPLVTSARAIWRFDERTGWLELPVGAVAILGPPPPVD